MAVPSSLKCDHDDTHGVSDGSRLKPFPVRREAEIGSFPSVDVLADLHTRTLNSAKGSHAAQRLRDPTFTRVTFQGGGVFLTLCCNHLGVETCDC